MTWSVPRMWEGETCAILASGPSMDASVAEQVKASGVKTIAVCRTVELAPWADMLYAADEVWWRNHTHLWKSFGGLKVTVEENGYRDVNKLTAGDIWGFNPDPSVVCTGGNSGYQALHVAAHAGCARVLLCGFDMHGLHWHPEYRSPMKTHGPEYFVEWVRRFGTLKEPLAERNVEVINCTPNSALRVWPYMPLDEALAGSSEICEEAAK